MVKLRKGTIHKAVNPSSGRVISVRGAKLKAWEALSKYIRAKFPTCVTCWAKPSSDCGHFRHNTDKPNKTLGGNEAWYYERNFGGQCNDCNRFHSGMRDAMALFLEEEYGHGVLQEVNRLYMTGKKWTIPELLEIEALYKQKLRELEA